MVCPQWVFIKGRAHLGMAASTCITVGCELSFSYAFVGSAKGPPFRRIFFLSSSHRFGCQRSHHPFTAGHLRSSAHILHVYFILRYSNRTQTYLLSCRFIEPYFLWSFFTRRRILKPFNIVWRRFILPAFSFIMSLDAFSPQHSTQTPNSTPFFSLPPHLFLQNN